MWKQFWSFRSSKTAIWAALYFEFLGTFVIFKYKIFQKWQSLTIWNRPKLISRKISSRNISKFPRSKFSIRLPRYVCFVSYFILSFITSFQERHLSTVHNPCKVTCPFCPIEVVHLAAHLATAHGLDSNASRSVASELFGKSAARTNIPFSPKWIWALWYSYISMTKSSFLF